MSYVNVSWGFPLIKEERYAKRKGISYVTHKCYVTGLSAVRFIRHLKHVAQNGPAKNNRASCDIMHFFRVRGWYHKDFDQAGAEDWQHFETERLWCCKLSCPILSLLLKPTTNSVLSLSSLKWWQGMGMNWRPMRWLQRMVISWGCTGYQEAGNQTPHTQKADPWFTFSTDLQAHQPIGWSPGQIKH